MEKLQTKCSFPGKGWYWWGHNITYLFRFNRFKKNLFWEFFETFT